MYCDAQIESDKVGFEVSCDAPAVFVDLATSVPGNFSVNGFAVTPWAPQQVTFRAQDDVSAQKFAEQLTLQSLFEPERGS